MNYEITEDYTAWILVFIKENKGSNHINELYKWIIDACLKRIEDGKDLRPLYAFIKNLKELTD